MEVQSDCLLLVQELDDERFAHAAGHGPIRDSYRLSRISRTALDVVGHIGRVAQELNPVGIGRVKFEIAFIGTDPKSQTVRAIQIRQPAGHLFAFNIRPDRRQRFKYSVFDLAGGRRRNGFALGLALFCNFLLNCRSDFGEAGDWFGLIEQCRCAFSRVDTRCRAFDHRQQAAGIGAPVVAQIRLG